MRFRYLILLVCLFVFGRVSAEDNNSFDVISVSQGLPNSNINIIYQGEKGLLWIGTSNGLCFYDGYSFNIIQSVPFDSTTLADDNIMNIVQTKSLNIFLHTNYGIEKISSETGEVTRVKHFLNSQDIVKIISSPETENLFILLKNGVLRYNESANFIDTLAYDESYGFRGGVIVDSSKLVVLDKNSLLNIDLQSDELIVSSNVKDIQPNVNHDVVVWDSKILFTRNKSLIGFNLLSDKHSIIGNVASPILGISNEVDNKVCIFTWNKLHLIDFNKGSGVNQNVIDFTLKGYSIRSIFQDRNQILWIATNRGIVKLNPHSDKIKHNRVLNNIFENNAIQNLIYESDKKGIAFKNNRGRITFHNSTTNQQYNLSINSCTQITFIDDEYFLVGNERGLFQLDITGKVDKRLETFNNLEIYSIKELDDVVWVSTSNGLYRGIEGVYEHICDLVIDKFIVFDKTVYYTSEVGFGQLDINSCSTKILLAESSKSEYVRIVDILQSFDGKIWLATDDGLYQFNPNAEQENIELFQLVYKGSVLSLIESKNLPEVWFSTDLGIGSVNYQTEQIMFLGYEDGVRQTSFIQEAAFAGVNGELVFLSQHESISFNPDSIFRNNFVPDVYISQVNQLRKDMLERKIYYPSDTFNILPDTRFVEISFTTFDYFAPLHTNFEYSLTRGDDTYLWKQLKNNTLSLGSVSPGGYTLNVRARNSHGVESEEIKKLIIIVKAPIYRSRMAIVVYIVLLVLFIISLIQLRTRNLSRKNREYKEKERIAKKVEQQKEELTLKNKNITDSINYARRIQLAMMPSDRLFSTIFPDSFILHMPKDIVSGDFYWVNHVNNKIFFSAVDCTGHGVPGAFMSIIGVELFRRITEIEKIFTPAEVLNSLSKNFERVFGDVDEMKLRDGMDLAFCSLNEEQTVLEYAGAFNPLYIVRNNSIMEIKGDRHSVGVYEDEDEIRSFNNHVIPLQDGDIVYVFTDGYVDQFGGPEGKKYKYRRFRHLLLALHQLPMDEQVGFLKNSILEWKGDQEQVDDILVMGIRIHHKKNK